MKSSDIKADEFGVYYKQYIDLAPSTNLIDGLQTTLSETIAFYNSIPSEKLDAAYEDGKWTPKEILQHIMDTERIFAYRALRFARNDKTQLPGYEQDDYVPPSHANKRSIADLILEYQSIRQASILLFKSFDDEMFARIGTASGNPMSARAVAAIICGHERHHVGVIKERYL